MGMINHNQIKITRQFLDRIGLKILKRALFPFDLNALIRVPLFCSRDHWIKATGMAPGHAFQFDSTHRPNSSRIWLLFSPMRGAARDTLGRCPLMRSGEHVVTMEISSSRVTV